MPAKVKKTNVTQLQKQIDELTEAVQRERADAMNLRARAEKERLQMADFYKGMVLSQLLPALDNLERSLLHVPKDLKGHDYIKGVQGVVKQFEKAFSELGVKRIKTIGEYFNPEVHEAIGVDDGDGEHEVVSEELQAGYQLGDQVIRHAMVRVKKA